MAERQYWDSSLFISFIKGNEPGRLEVIRALLDVHEKGGIHIVISEIVVAEVRAIPKEAAPGPAPGQEDRVETEPFDTERWNRIQEAFRFERLDRRAVIPYISEKAAEIGNQFPKLLPVDCIHIATALHAEVNVLLTYDGASLKRRRTADLLRYDGKIGNPPLRIREPWILAGPLFEPTEKLEP